MNKFPSLADIKKQVYNLEQVYRERNEVREKLRLIIASDIVRVPVEIVGTSVDVDKSRAEDMLREAVRDVVRRAENICTALNVEYEDDE